MVRDLSRHPWHVSKLNTWQSFHSDQGPKVQFLGHTHGTSASQPRVSDATPTAGFPQKLASCSTSRVLVCKPPSQVLEHLPHSSQTPHLPSVHWPPEHRSSELQGSISCLVWGAQGSPPGPALCAVWRKRCRVPPAHVLVHEFQSCHSCHEQFVILQTTEAQGSMAVRLPTQPRPPPEASVSMARLRWRKPAPQLALHIPQSCHAPSSQSVTFTGLQGSLLQGSVFMRLLGQASMGLFQSMRFGSRTISR
mmetsp:Transcript_115378/g.326069  ORF Transcript_115378/g.326069 Transcript_115378/m.326069 type:complete len:250 (+) Transcript_115378:1141-1890(+)